MNMFRTAALALPLHLALAAPLMAADPVALDSEDQQISYALGLLMGTQFGAQFDQIEFDGDALIAGFEAGDNGGEAQMTPQEAQTMIQAYAVRMQEAAAAQKAEEAAAFMTENAARAEVTVTESGLQYEVLAEGDANGASPTLSDTVKVHYTGKLLNGKVFDSSVARGEPATFPVSGVIAGWTEALQLMKPGTKFRVWIPSEIAYGARGAGNDIGPNETLTFDMELLEIIGN